MMRMTFTYAKGISPQGYNFYKLVHTRGTLTTRDIATSLHTHPNAIYRIAHYLTKVGLIEELPTTPVTFRAITIDDAKKNYLSYQQAQFESLLGSLSPDILSTRQTEDYQVSFIQGREEIFECCAQDLRNAKQEARFIVLGLPIGVSPELMLEQKNAVARGVPVRIIVQEYSSANRNTIRSWKLQGLDVRQGKPIGFHLLLIDGSISFLMYYDQKDKTKRYAVRIVHQAINLQLQKIFNNHWKTAKPISIRGVNTS